MPRYYQMMALALGLAGASVALAWEGGQGLWDWMTNRAPKEVACAELARARPSATWLTLKGCQGSILAASFAETSGRVTELFVPLHPAGATAPGAAPVVLATKDGALLGVAQQLSEVSRKRDQGELERWVMRNRERLLLERDFSGMVRYGFDSDGETQTKLKALGARKLAPDFVILDDGRQPGLAKGLYYLVAGVGAAVAAVFLFLRRERFHD